MIPSSLPFNLGGRSYEDPGVDDLRFVVSALFHNNCTAQLDCTSCGEDEEGTHEARGGM